MEAAYRQALHIDPKEDFALYGLGLVYSDLKRYDDAIETYRQALHIDPEGVAYVISGNRTATLEIIRDLRRLDPVIADRLFNLIAPR